MTAFARGQTAEIDAGLVRRLIATQFPQWAHLPITPVPHSGWDNRTFRLGTAMSVRLPSAEGYAPQVAKEQRWLPFLQPHLPLPIPAPLALGRPNLEYPHPWSVYQWLEGDSAAVAPPDDLERFALDLAAFLNALQRVNATDGPPPGQHSAHRGGPLLHYDAETRAEIQMLGDAIDGEAALMLWERALESVWNSPSVWFHGDVASGNLLLKDGRLSAVIDFGCAGVGDPACDTVIAWTNFSGQSRAAFQSALHVDEATWTRGRAWALWKALIVSAECIYTDPAKAAQARAVINAVLRDV